MSTEDTMKVEWPSKPSGEYIVGNNGQMRDSDDPLVVELYKQIAVAEAEMRLAEIQARTIEHRAQIREATLRIAKAIKETEELKKQG